MTRHVVFGTGQVGRLVAEQLAGRGVDVVAVNRNGQGEVAGARVLGGYATDPAFTTRAAAGADVVYFCLNAMNYTRWVEEFPPLQRAVVAAAQPPALAWWCSTTSTPTALPAEVTSSSPSRPGRPRPRPRPGPP